MTKKTIIKNADEVLAIIKISSIIIGERLRPLDPTNVDALAEEFIERPQRTPINVYGPTEKGEHYLRAGGHRIGAQLKNGKDEILALIKPMEFFSEDAMRLDEITENMARVELKALDRAVNIAAWCDIFEAKNGKKKPGPKSKASQTDAELDELSASFALNYSDAAQVAFGIGRRSVFLARKIATVDAPVRKKIGLLPIASKQSELLALAAEPKKRQLEIANLLVKDPTQSVAAIVAIIDKAPPPTPAEPWKQASNTVSSLNIGDRDRLFSFLRPTFELWLAEQD